MRRALIPLLALAAAPPAGAAEFALDLHAPPSVGHGRVLTLRARVTPTLVHAPVTLFRDGAPVTTIATGTDGVARFRLRATVPATYEARAGELASAPRAPLVRPRLVARIEGKRVVGRPLRLVVRVAPAEAGLLRIVVTRNGRAWSDTRHAGARTVRLPTGAAGDFRARVSLEPASGFARVRRALRASVVHPRLALGSRGPSVRALERRLRELRYALQRVDGSYGLDTYQAVLAFQKVRGLAWTGRVDPTVWRALARANVPRARYRGSHIEVSKGRQYLLIVRGGRVALVVHVSTGATGNTPLGRWRIYRKVRGWDWVLWYPLYFLRGFAIHGYPSVPAYPASHGCVRVPMWVAPRLWAAHGYGQTVYVYP